MRARVVSGDLTGGRKRTQGHSSARQGRPRDSITCLQGGLSAHRAPAPASIPWREDATRGFKRFSALLISYETGGNSRNTNTITGIHARSDGVLKHINTNTESITRGQFLIILLCLFSCRQVFTCKPPELRCEIPPFRLQREQSNSINSSCWEKGRPFPGAIHNI